MHSMPPLATFNMLKIDYWHLSRLSYNLVIYKTPVNGFQHLRVKRKHIKEHKMNPRGSWRYNAVLWSETISLCKKLNIIITCDPEPRANSKIWLFSTN